MDLSPQVPGERSPAASRGAAASAPAVMSEKYRPLSTATNAPRHGELSYDATRLRPVAPSLLAAKEPTAEDFELDPTAPLRAVKQRSLDSPYVDAEGIRRWDAAVGESLLEYVKEEEEHGNVPAGDEPQDKGKAPETQPTDGEKKDEGPVWGESFKIEWLKVERLPFYRTRHLRNPWNHDREVKVSRDGTELEPLVGHALLEEWENPDPHPAGQPPRSGTRSTPAERTLARQSAKD